MRIYAFAHVLACMYAPVPIYIYIGVCVYAYRCTYIPHAMHAYLCINMCIDMCI